MKKRKITKTSSPNYPTKPKFTPELLEVCINNKTLKLRKKEYQLLQLFFNYKNKILNKHFIISHLWQLTPIIQTNTLEVHISKLREILKHYKFPYTIKTVYGAGYRLIKL